MELIQTLPAEVHAVTADTFLVPTVAAEPSGAFITVSTMVIRGAEPVLVDTGCSLVRDAWLDATFSVVDPEDVRWVFLSHDDHDHIGNLDAVLSLCPQATVVGNWSMTGRLAGDVPLPVERMRWLDPGDAFDAGDRTLHLVRPPLFDSPATRGLFDPTTGVLWAVDSFGALVQGAVMEADDADPELYAGSFGVMNQWNSPWLEWIDPARFAEHLVRTASLPTTAVASAHGPILRGSRIAAAFAATAALAAQPIPPTPGQAMLDELLAAFIPAPGLGRGLTDLENRSTTMGTLPRSGRVEVTTDASPEQVWRLLADVTRAGDWSHETRGAEWLDGATTVAAGARFRGLNGKGRQKWTRVCEIEVADEPHRLVWRTIGSRVYRDSTRWTYELTPVDGGGTRVNQQFEVLQLGPVMDRLFYALIPAHRDRTAALQGDLEELVAQAAKAPVSS